MSRPTFVQRLEGVLAWAEAGCPDNTPVVLGCGDYNAGCGICYNSGCDISEAYATWPEYSGEEEYPVPGGEAVYQTSSIPKWSGEYGAARIRLLKHCIEYFKEKTA